ncbi:MAG: hypothetical protein ACI9FN_001317 [Saprospiraceae bacterium]|jgi:hypothetical protein
MRIGLVMLLLFSSLYVWGQQTMIIPQQYEESVQGAERLEDIVFYSYPYEFSSVDVRDMKKRYPELQIADTIEIIPPEFETFSDVTLLMAILRESGSESKLVIWIAGNYERDRVTLYVDETLDRDFTNDGRSRILRAGKNATSIKVYPYGENKRSRNMNISIPERNNPIDNAVRQLGDFSLLSMTNRFSVGVHAGFGGGKLNYNLDNLDTGFPIWYNVTLSEIQIGMSLNYHIEGLRLGLKGTYQSVKQYTSYYNVRIAEPSYIVNANTGERIYRENVATSNNIDLHSSTRFQLGMLAGLRINIGKYLEVQPTATMGYLFYSSGEYIANKFLEPELNFVHKKDPFVEGGIRFEFITGRFRSFSLGMNYTLVNWRPEGFADSFNGENFDKKYSTIGVSVGYNIGF